MSDPEDSQMHEGRSSTDTSDDAADSNAMFPSELDPPGPSSQTAVINGGLAASTPPQSQDLNNDVMDTQESSSDANISTRETGWGNGGSGMSAFAQSALTQESHEPGAAWNNKKAMDEYQRAVTQIEDKGFNLKEFGDPFDEEQERGNGKR